MSGKQLLEGKVALVTGGGRGIGRDYALAFAAAGAKVLVNDLGGTTQGEGADRVPAMEVAKEIEDSGGKAVVNFDSVSDFSAAQGMVDQAVEELGGLDIVVNNAGILRDVIFHKMTEDDWDSVIAVHLKGSFNVSRAAASVFREKESGAFIHMTSTSGLIGNFGQANYGAAKMAMLGFMNVLAIEGASHNVRVNCLAPGAATRMTASVPGSTFDADNPPAEMDPSLVSPAVLYMCSEDAPSAVTIHASGGRYSRSQTYVNEGIALGPEATFDEMMDSIDGVMDMSASTPLDPVNRRRG